MICYICKKEKEWFVEEFACMDCYDRVMEVSYYAMD